MTIGMSYLKFPRIRMYWASATRVPMICETMSRERYLLLRRNLKVVDDALISDETRKSNKFWKVQPLIDTVRQACLANPRSSKVSIDEQMVPFWGSCPSRQVVRGKPNPCGLKIFVSASPDGLPLDFFLYQGAGDSITDDPACTDLNIGGKVVMRLAETLNAGTILYIDRYFTSVYLLDLLHSERLMQATGTLDLRRIPKEIKFKSDAELLRAGRGSWDQVVRDDEQICVVKWYDNKPVIVASSNEGTFPPDICHRWDKKNKVYVDVSRPSSIRNYNANMGGIDLLDRLISFYRISGRTRKWTVRVIFHLFDFALVAAWIYYRRQQQQQTTPRRDQLDSFEFRRRIAEHLVYSSTSRAVAVYELVESDQEDSDNERPKKKKKRTLPHPPPDLRTTMALHLPTIPDAEKCYRCRMPGCKSNRARFQCTTCKMHLCITKDRNCFKSYHEM
uniref:PiggyBac transposable element-derived protein domain-containing protein n=1 Tax=Homalodisca liturata TaxID=320908 RepID=A0A1B6IDW9_9HEMI